MMKGQRSAKPSWHSDESWAIEMLNWKTSELDFEKLTKYVLGRIRSELAGRGADLEKIATQEALCQQVRDAALAYDDRHKRIGLAAHATLWVRAFVASKMRGEEW